MTYIAIKLAQIIFPNESNKNSLLNRMTTNRNFLTFSLPNGFYNLKMNTVVFNINKYVDTLDKKNQLFKEQLISLLSSCLNTWIQRYIGVGITTKQNSSYQEVDYCAGFTLPPELVLSRSTTRNKRVGPREYFFTQ